MGGLDFSPVLMMKVTDWALREAVPPSCLNGTSSGTCGGNVVRAAYLSRLPAGMEAPLDESVTE